MVAEAGPPAPALRPLPQPSNLPAAPMPVAAPSQPLRLAAPQAVAPPGPAPALRPLQSLAAASEPQPAPGAAPTAQANAAAPGQAPAGSPSGAGPAQVAAGGPTRPHPGCALEVLVLLTPEEKVRCRNEIDAAAARLARQRAEERSPGLAAYAGPQIDRISPQRRAYFDAVAASREQVRNGVGSAPSLQCNLGALFGGDGPAPGEKIKIPGLPCIIKPPVGVLTHELSVPGR